MLSRVFNRISVSTRKVLLTLCSAVYRLSVPVCTVRMDSGAVEEFWRDILHLWVFLGLEPVSLEWKMA